MSFINRRVPARIIQEYKNINWLRLEDEITRIIVHGALKKSSDWISAELTFDYKSIVV